jgi:hypothetical protein
MPADSPFCPACGTRNEADAAFCEGCGSPLGQTGVHDARQAHAQSRAGPVNPQHGYPAQMGATSAPRSANKRVIVALVLLAAGVAAYQLLPWRQWMIASTATAVDSASAADSAFGTLGGVVEPHIMGNPNTPDAPPLGPWQPGDSTASITVLGGDSILTAGGDGELAMYFQLALAMELQNSWSFAEGVYRQILDADANNADAHAGLAGTLLRQGKRDQAVAEAQRARQLGHPGTHWVFKELGGE